MSQNIKPKYCNFCGAQLRTYGGGKQVLYCDRTCKASFLSIIRLEHKLKLKVT